MPTPDTNAKGLLLLCDLNDGGSLYSAMHSSSKDSQTGQLTEDYRGELYNKKLGTLGSVAIQIILGLRHMHTRGIMHQDINPVLVLFARLLVYYCADW